MKIISAPFGDRVSHPCTHFDAFAALLTTDRMSMVTTACTHLMGSLTVAPQFEKDIAPLLTMGTHRWTGDDVRQLMEHRVAILTPVLLETEDRNTEPDLFALGTCVSCAARQTATEANRRFLETIPVVGKPLTDFIENLLSLSLQLGNQLIRRRRFDFSHDFHLPWRGPD